MSPTGSKSYLFDTNLILPAASLHGDARGARGPDRGRGGAVDAAVVALGVDLLLPGRALRHARRPRIRTLRRNGPPHRLPHAGTIQNTYVVEVVHYTLVAC